MIFSPSALIISLPVLENLPQMRYSRMQASEMLILQKIVYEEIMIVLLKSHAF